MRVAICIATYKRPDMLEDLLKSISNLEFKKVDAPDIKIVIVDNDAEGSAKDVVENAVKYTKFPIIYAIEPQKGLAYARNKTIELAGDVDFVAIVDDDEIVSKNWLDELLHVQQKYDADVVSGPVIPRFKVTPPEWVVKGRFFERPRFNTGEKIDMARTGNVLIRKNVLEMFSPPFDYNFNLTGGEDTFLFKKIHLINKKIVWSDDAIIEEWVPKERMSIWWLLRRSFRAGTTTSAVELYLHPSFKTIIARLSKSIVHITLGILSFIFYISFRPEKSIKSLQRTAAGIGNFIGVFGFRYEEYR